MQFDIKGCVSGQAPNARQRAGGWSMSAARRVPAPLTRTPRDDQLLDALACRVRLFSLEQIAAAWWGDADNPQLFAGRRLTQLESDGWIDRCEVHAGPMLELTAPLVRWVPGAAAPDPKVIATELARRWRTDQAPPVVTIFSATKQTNQEFGGPERIKRIGPLHATHDLNVAALFLLFLKTRPEDAAAWIGEDIRPKAGYRLKDPDALLEYPDGRPVTVIELGGRYKAEDIQAFHLDCERRQRSYELW
ncbi:MAG: hypothetical protein AMXMBFR83_31870 [Phycisphaerae bacterium]